MWSSLSLFEGITTLLVQILDKLTSHAQDLKSLGKMTASNISPTLVRVSLVVGLPYLRQARLTNLTRISMDVLTKYGLNKLTSSSVLI